MNEIVARKHRVNCFGRQSARLIVIVACGLAALGISAAVMAQTMSRSQARARAAALTALGKALFSDPRLSESGQLACAGCHDPAHAFAQRNTLAVQLGGPKLETPGLRAVPSLKYLQVMPQFSEHYFEPGDEANESIDNGPTGGLNWDGRADSGHAQAEMPLLSPFEMGNHDADAVVQRVLGAGYGRRIAAIYGKAILDDRTAVYRAVLKAFEVYEQDPQTFYPYSSKYDAWLAGTVTLTAAEMRGLKLFEDPGKGNCASCHFSEPDRDSAPPQFTDWGMIALAVPRNPAIPANASPKYYDLGLCGPLRTDFHNRSDYCGLFRTPSLRNVATRKVFFHNGVFHSLREAVEFYATRDTNPARWYPRRADGSVDIYNDLPKRYWDNINRDPPFGGEPGGKPQLNDAQIDDIVAFLKTLTDGWESKERRAPVSNG